MSSLVIILNANIIALSNQKGGVGKTTTTVSPGVGLGYPCSLSTLLCSVMTDEPIIPVEAILHHAEGVDLLPASIELSGMEVSLVNAMSRETMLRQVLEPLKKQYDHILIDCMPSLGMLTINALAAANSVIIPVQAQYLPAKGLEQLLKTVSRVQRQINPKLKIDGILLTMVDSRTNYARDISQLLRETYSDLREALARTWVESVAVIRPLASPSSMHCRTTVSNSRRNTLRNDGFLRRSCEGCCLQIAGGGPFHFALMPGKLQKVLDKRGRPAYNTFKSFYLNYFS